MNSHEKIFAISSTNSAPLRFVRLRAKRKLFRHTLHLALKGYDIWGDAISSKVKEIIVASGL